MEYTCRIVTLNQSGIIAFLFTCTLLLQAVHASWWYLGLASSGVQYTLDSPNINFRSKCEKVNVFAPRQKELCLRSRNVLDVISEGAKTGIEECQFQFQDRRWNCTTFNNTSVFGEVLDLNSREKAYIYAVSSAGVMFSVTKACARGELNICGCDQKIRKTNTNEDFIWGGCSHNIKFGEKFSKEFVDANEPPKQSAGLMNLWNNGAGRKSIRENMRLLCKCHGVSGSCSVKICWKTMANFREIGRELKNKFDGASQVTVNKKGNKLRPIDRRQKKPERNDLVYLDESPDFCEPNHKFGSVGTTGRLCNKTSYGLDGCNLMCCGRGYYTMIKEVEEDCNCKFYWCCRVECDKCRRSVEEHFCK